MSERQSQRQRSTAETNISIDLHVDGDGRSEISTGLPFFDHMLAQLARHGGWSLTVSAQGDLDVDSHHTVEDTGILLGQCFAEALGDKRGGAPVRLRGGAPRRGARERGAGPSPAARSCTTRWTRPARRSWATPRSIPS